MSTLPITAGRNGNSYVLITGGSGFIGCNVAHDILSRGHRVLILDNLSRSGVIENFRWLQSTHGDAVELRIGNIRDKDVVRDAVRHAGAVFHFAAQVAVTTSLDNPIRDFEVNAAGTLNLLEAIRRRSNPPPLLYTSTNKVYGHLGDLALRSTATRYAPASPAHTDGISEAQPLDFHSPYGCSKGSAEQYILDYHRTYGLPTCVFRMSCIYGPHQFGNEDQRWVAHFLICALEARKITIYGNGRQVRDILSVEDLANAFRLAWKNIGTVAGHAFNIGGGPANTISLVELVDVIPTLTGQRPEIETRPWRTVDQRYYVSNTRKFQALTGWHPNVGVETGLKRLCTWLQGTRLRPLQSAAA